MACETVPTPPNNSQLRELCDCNSCSPDPEVILAVTGASGSINWCGQTWNLPGDSGVDKIICPTDYVRQQNLQGTPTSVWQATHTWRYDTVNGLEIRLDYMCFDTGGTPGFDRPSFRFSPAGANVKSVLLKNLNDFAGGLFSGSGSSRPVLPVFLVSSPDIAGVITAMGQTFNDYDISDDMFSTYILSGITYSWRRGGGWP
jgi:hypothetical protein